MLPAVNYVRQADPDAIVLLGHGESYHAFGRVDTNLIKGMVSAGNASEILYRDDGLTQWRFKSSRLPHNTSWLVKELNRPVVTLEWNEYATSFLQPLRNDSHWHFLSRTIPDGHSDHEFSVHSESQNIIVIGIQGKILKGIKTGEKSQRRVGITCFDPTNGSMSVQGTSLADLRSHIVSFRPRAIVLDSSLIGTYRDIIGTALLGSPEVKFTNMPPVLGSLQLLNDFFDVSGEIWRKCFDDYELYSLKAAVEFIKKTQKSTSAVFQLPSRELSSQWTVLLDKETISSLNLGSTGSHYMNSSWLLQRSIKTATVGGSRMLYKSILRPTRIVSEILFRQRAVQSIIKRKHTRQKLSSELSSLPDIPLLLQKLKIYPESEDLVSTILHSIDIISSLAPIASKFYMNGRQQDADFDDGDLIYRIPSAKRLEELRDRARSLLNASDTMHGVVSSNTSIECNDRRTQKATLVNGVDCGPNRNTSFSHSVKNQTGDVSLETFMVSDDAELNTESPSNLTTVLDTRTVSEHTHPKGLGEITSSSLDYRDLHATHRIDKLAGQISELHPGHPLPRAKVIANCSAEILRHKELILLFSRLLSRLDMLLSFANVAIQHDDTRPIVDPSRTNFEIHLKDKDFNAAADPLLMSNSSSVLWTKGERKTVAELYGLYASIILLAHSGAYVPAKSANIGVVSHMLCQLRSTNPFLLHSALEKSMDGRRIIMCDALPDDFEDYGSADDRLESYQETLATMNVGTNRLLLRYH